ncbi:unnamed protein product [Linum tenue]|uniref:Uncharacterized protein n=1 Tax=Linum tenue TaxID=586396 RepID=A0AAV0KTW9_9ROSI|nr:unnamed protein product [Linum tenue]
MCPTVVASESHDALSFVGTISRIMQPQENKVKAAKWAEPFLGTVGTKRIPTVKDKLVVVTHIRSLSATAVEAYETSKTAIIAHIVLVQKNDGFLLSGHRGWVSWEENEVNWAADVFKGSSPKNAAAKLTWITLISMLWGQGSVRFTEVLLLDLIMAEWASLGGPAPQDLRRAQTPPPKAAIHSPHTCTAANDHNKSRAADENPFPVSSSVYSVAIPCP